MATAKIGENNPDLMNAILHSCRVCMANSMNMSYIFDPRPAHGTSVSERITFCTGLQVAMNDGLPTKICELCLNNLQVAYSFKSMCILSHGKFAKIVQGSQQLKMEQKDENSDVDEEVPDIKDFLNGCQHPDQMIKVEAIFEEVNVENVQKINDSMIKKKPKDENSDDNDEVHVNKNTLYADSDQIIKVEETYEEVNAENEQKSRKGSTITKKCLKDKSISQQPPNIGERTNKLICTVCCKQNFSTPASLRCHTRKLHPTEYQEQRRRQKQGVEENAIKCHICGTEFKRMKSLKQHIQYKHGFSISTKLLVVGVYGENPVKCQVCGKVCANEYVLEVHRGRHSKCPDCSEMFFRSNALQRHRHEVHGLQLPSCGICDYVNVRQANVDQHQRQVHMKEKLVKCDHCAMWFSSKNNLKMHMVSHNPDKKHKCRFCNKRFARTRTLKLHEKIHTGEKTKVCGICDAKFVQKASLNYHMVKHHPDSV